VKNACSSCTSAAGSEVCWIIAALLRWRSLRISPPRRSATRVQPSSSGTSARDPYARGTPRDWGVENGHRPLRGTTPAGAARQKCGAVNATPARGGLADSSERRPHWRSSESRSAMVNTAMASSAAAERALPGCRLRGRTVYRDRAAGAARCWGGPARTATCQTWYCGSPSMAGRNPNGDRKRLNQCFGEFPARMRESRHPRLLLSVSGNGLWQQTSTTPMVLSSLDRDLSTGERPAHIRHRSRKSCGRWLSMLRATKA